MTAIRGRSGAPVVGIAGWKKSGKTTLTVRLVEELTRRGYRVATVKHAHHRFEIDDSDADSARHRRAGADQVAVVSATRWALIRELNDAPEPDFADVIAWLEPCDLILVEGYKSAPIPKIEARRAQSFTRRPLADADPLIFAIAADDPAAHGHDRLPVLPLDDINGLTDILLGHVGLARTKTGPELERHANKD